MNKRTRVVLVVLALAVAGGAVAGAILVRKYRHQQIQEEIGRVAKQVVILTLQYRKEALEIVDSMFQQREIDSAAYFGSASQDPEARFDWRKATAALDRWYMENLDRIDASSCALDFREAFEEYVQAVRACEGDPPESNEALKKADKELREAGTRLTQVADSHKTLIMLPMGHRD